MNVSKMIGHDISDEVDGIEDEDDVRMEVLGKVSEEKKRGFVRKGGSRLGHWPPKPELVLLPPETSPSGSEPPTVHRTPPRAQERHKGNGHL